MWWINAVTWKDPSSAKFLTTASAISKAASGGMLSTKITGFIVNCPFVEASTALHCQEGKRQSSTSFFVPIFSSQLSAKLTQEMKIEHE
jgi:hypothetical protein